MHLVPLDKVETVKEVWEKEYYRRLFPEISDERLKESIVVSKLGSATSISPIHNTPPSHSPTHNLPLLYCQSIWDIFPNNPIALCFSERFKEDSQYCDLDNDISLFLGSLERIEGSK